MFQIPTFKRRKPSLRLGLVSDSRNDSGLALMRLARRLEGNKIPFALLQEPDSITGASTEVINEMAMDFLSQDEANFIIAISISGNSFQIAANKHPSPFAAASARTPLHARDALEDEENIRVIDISSQTDSESMLLITKEVLGFYSESEKRSRKNI